MTSHRTSSWVAAIAIAAVSLLAVNSAESVPELTFDQGNSQSGGWLYYTGTAGDPIVGLDIQFFNITPNADITQNSSVGLTCQACFLDFETGPVTSSSIAGVNASFEASAGGSFTLNGTILSTGLGTGFAGFTGDIIFNGEFSAAPFKPEVKILGSQNTGSFTGFGFDEKACSEEQIANEECLSGSMGETASLIAFYALGPNFSFSDTTVLGELVVLDPMSAMIFDLNGNMVTIGPGGFLINVSTADVTNRPRVPEPGTSVILLLGFGALAAFRRRR